MKTTPYGQGNKIIINLISFWKIHLICKFVKVLTKSTTLIFRELFHKNDLSSIAPACLLHI